MTIKHLPEHIIQRFNAVGELFGQIKELEKQQVKLEKVLEVERRALSLATCKLEGIGERIVVNGRVYEFDYSGDGYPDISVKSCTVVELGEADCLEGEA